MPSLFDEEITATYAGLRAAIDRDDYLIDVDARAALRAGRRNPFHRADVRDGDRRVRDGAARRGGPRRRRARRICLRRRRMPNLGEVGVRPYQDAERIAADPEYGRIVCFCERVTAGEIRDAFQSPIPPADLDGLRRRTRVMNGRCQGFYCGAHTRAAARTQRGERSDDRPACRGRDRRWRTVRADRRRRAGAGGRRRGAGHRARSRRPAESRATATIPATACAISSASSPVPPTPGGSPRWRRMPVRCWRPRRWSPAGPASADCRSPRPAAMRTVTADAVVLATGARERPRPARLIPGDRPDGVYTTGQLQNLVHLHHARRRQPRRDRRRRTGQLVGGIDTARIRLRHRRDGQRIPARGGLCGVSGARAGC